MPDNLFSVWSEIIDFRDEKTKRKYELTEDDKETIQKLFRGEHGGLKLHKLKGTRQTVISVYTNEVRRLLFMPKGSTLALVEILEKHKYDTSYIMQPGVAERLFQKPWNDIKDEALQFEPIVSIENFSITPAYQYHEPSEAISYHQKLVTLDDTQSGVFTVKTPAVIIGDPGSGKSIISSAMMREDCLRPDFIDAEKYIMYFSESRGLAATMKRKWLLDHPVTARQARARRIIFSDYAKVLTKFGPDSIKEKKVIGEPEFNEYILARLGNRQLIKQKPFIEHEWFRQLVPTLYHEFQIITVCMTKERYTAKDRKSNFRHECREWLYEEYERYQKILSTEGKAYDPNLFLFEPRYKPFYRVYHDEALSASPAVNLMLHRLTEDANIISFADPNQENSRQMSDLDYIISELGVNGHPAEKRQLSVTYRLPPTIAALANCVLTIKQNINGGKNEKNQSTQVVCKNDEHQHPGSLEWIRLENAQSLIDHLNGGNHVYTVITYPEYMEEAKQRFGDDTYVCSIEEARGQEFEIAVLYRVTDQPTVTHEKDRSRREQSILQKINKCLSLLDDDLQSKPNLAKSAVINRYFEAYLNGIYIAISRITKCGYLIEAGDSTKNELHRRLKKAIDEAMKDVVIGNKVNTLSKDEIWLQATRDLQDGRWAQAKAGYLRAGRSLADFESDLMQFEKDQTKLIDSILGEQEASNDGHDHGSASISKSRHDNAYLTLNALTKDEKKQLEDAIQAENKAKFKSFLKKLNNAFQLFEKVTLKGQETTSYLWCCLHSAKLRPVLFEYLFRKKECIPSLFSRINFDHPVIFSESVGKGEMKPLIIAMISCEIGRRIMAETKNILQDNVFSGLSENTLFQVMIENASREKMSLLECAMAYYPSLFFHLFNQHLSIVKAYDVKYWFNKKMKMKGSTTEKCSMVNTLISMGNYDKPDVRLSMKSALQVIFKLAVATLAEDAMKEILNEKWNVLIEGQPETQLSLFDLLLVTKDLTDLAGIFIPSCPAMFTPAYLLSRIFYNSKSTRLSVLMRFLDMIPSLRKIMNQVDPGELNEIYAPYFEKLFPERKKRGVNTVKQDSPHSEDEIKPSVEEANRDKVLNILTADKGYLMLLKKNDNGILLTSLLDNQVSKKHLYEILSDKNHPKKKVIQNNIVMTMCNLDISNMIRVAVNDALTVETPILFHIADQHIDFNQKFIGGFSPTVSRREVNSVFISKYKSACYDQEINYPTIIGLKDSRLLLMMLEAAPPAIARVDWLTLYTRRDNGDYSSALSVLAKQSSQDIFEKCYDLLCDNKSTFCKNIKIEQLFFKIVDQDQELTVFDAMMESDRGIRLLSLYNGKLITHPAFDEVINARFLSGALVVNQDVFTRSNRLLQHELLFPLLFRVFHKKESVNQFIDSILITHPVSLKCVENFKWNGLASVLSNPAAIGLVNQLIAIAPDRMANLPEAVWHAPAEHVKTLGFENSHENFLMMHLVLRLHARSGIEAFFKTHYPDVIERAIKTLANSIMTPYEKKLEQRRHIELISADAIIQESRTELLGDILSKPGLYPLLNTPYSDVTVFQAIMSNNKLRDWFLTCFMDLQEICHIDYFMTFIEHISLGEVFGIDLKNNGVMKEISFIAFLVQHEDGRKLIDGLIEYDAGMFVKKLKSEVFLRTSGELSSNALMVLVIQNQIKLFIAMCDYTDLIKEILLNDQDSNIGMIILQALVAPLMSAQIDRAACILRIEALCSLFESSPDSVMYWLAELLNGRTSSGGHSFLEIVSIVSPLKLTTRLLDSVGHCEKFASQMAVKLKMPVLTNVIDPVVRNYRVNGFIEAEMQHLMQMLLEENENKFSHILEDRCIEVMLTLPLGDGRPFIMHIFEHNKLRRLFLDALKFKLTDLHPNLMNMVFTNRVLTSLITIDGSKVPFINYLMEDDDAYFIVRALEKSCPGFYAKLSSSTYDTNYTSLRYKTELSLIDVMSLLRIDSLNMLVIQYQKLFYFSKLAVWLAAKKLDETSFSLLGNVLLKTGDEKAAVLSILDKLLPSETYTDLSSIPLEWWMQCNLTQPGQVNKVSLFDLFLSSPATCRYLGLVLSYYLIGETLSNIELSYILGELKVNDLTMPRLYFISDCPEVLYMLSVLMIRGGLTFLRSPNDLEALYQALIKPCFQESSLGTGSSSALGLMSASKEGRDFIMTLLHQCPQLAALFSPDVFHDIHADSPIILARLFTYSEFDFSSIRDVFKANAAVDNALNVFELSFERDVSCLLEELSHDGTVITDNISHQRCLNAVEYELYCWVYALQDDKLINQLMTTLISGKSLFLKALDKKVSRDALVWLVANQGREGQRQMLIKYRPLINLHEWFAPDNGMKQSTLSVLVHLLGVESIKDVFYTDKDSPYYYLANPLSQWLTPVDSGDGWTMNQLDFLLIEPGLAEVAKLLINKHLKDYMRLCFNNDYLLASIQTSQGVMTRLSLMLMNEVLHSLFMLHLRAADLPYDELASYLRSTAVASLRQSPMGENIINQLSKMPKIVKLTAEASPSMVQSSDKTMVSVTGQGLFQAAPVPAAMPKDPESQPSTRVTQV